MSDLEVEEDDVEKLGIDPKVEVGWSPERERENGGRSSRRQEASPSPLVLTSPRHHALHPSLFFFSAREGVQRRHCHCCQVPPSSNSSSGEKIRNPFASCCVPPPLYSFPSINFIVHPAAEPYRASSRRRPKEPPPRSISSIGRLRFNSLRP